MTCVPGGHRVLTISNINNINLVPTTATTVVKLGYLCQGLGFLIVQFYFYFITLLPQYRIQTSNCIMAFLYSIRRYSNFKKLIVFVVLTISVILSQTIQRIVQKMVKKNHLYLEHFIFQPFAFSCKIPSAN